MTLNELLESAKRCKDGTPTADDLKKSEKQIELYMEAYSYLAKIELLATMSSLSQLLTSRLSRW